MDIEWIQEYADSVENKIIFLHEIMQTLGLNSYGELLNHFNDIQEHNLRLMSRTVLVDESRYNLVESTYQQNEEARELIETLANLESKNG